MSYYLYLVETKKEYTIHLVNSLAPLIYEGISSIYEDAKNNGNNGEELKLFQSLLRKIPSWNNHLIEQETNRIIKLSQKGDIIEDLIKAVIKSNIMILTNTPPEKKDNIRIKHDITSEKFIHNSYIEVARNIFQNPYLFYHNFESYQLKKNQRESLEVIKKSIEQSIRKLLPMNVILQNYLGSTFNEQTDDFQNTIPDSDYNNLRHLLNKDPTDGAYELVKKMQYVNEADRQEGIRQEVSIQEVGKQSVKNTNINQNTNVTINNNDLIVELNTKSTKPKEDSTENFKALKELAKQNIGSVDNKANKIILEKTENAIRESEKQAIKKQTENNDIEKTLQSSSDKSNKLNDLNKSVKEASRHSVSDASSESLNQSEALRQSENKTKTQNIPNKQIEHKTNLQNISFRQTENKFNTQNIQNITNKTKSNNRSRNDYDTEDASISYFKQMTNNNELGEIYDNNKIKEEQIISDNKSSFLQFNESKYAQNGGSKNKKEQINQSKQDIKQIDKPFINYDDILNGNSSVNLKSIMNDVSSLNNDNINANNKKKYFNKTSNL